MAAPRVLTSTSGARNCRRGSLPLAWFRPGPISSSSCHRRSDEVHQAEFFFPDSDDPFVAAVADTSVAPLFDLHDEADLQFRCFQNLLLAF